MKKPFKIIGGQESYFTGKIEAYFRAKGLAYENIPFTFETILEAASLTGFIQIPQVSTPANDWLIDTTLIIDHLEREHPAPQLSPVDPSAKFIALLLEDYADEWMWRPAMHYRWSYPESSELVSYWLSEHLPGPETTLEEKQAFWKERQHGTFVKGDGVTEENTAAVESAYLSALAALEDIFQKRDYILGDRPTQADFGFMGPMFRHFFCDPKPARVMRDTAPAVQEWVARMWNSNPQRFSNAAPISSLASDLNALIEPVTSAYLPYLRANELAVNAEQANCNYSVLGSDFSEPAKPYRLWCLDQLRIQYQGLDAQAKQQVDTLLDEPSIALLSMEKNGSCDYLIPALPIKTKGNGDAIYDSWGRTPDVNENPLKSL